MQSHTLSKAQFASRDPLPYTQPPEEQQQESGEQAVQGKATVSA